MLLGKKGVKYGLQLPAKPAPKQGKKPQAAISAFQEGSDDEDTIGKQIARQQAKISTDVKVANMHAKALEEDPSIFDYDSHFDAMQEQKVRPAMQEKIERKSRYIEALKDKAVQREREQNVVYERRLAKERSAEDHLFGDKEKFVTAAYKQKLEEEKRWLAEEKLREAQEQKNDVVKKGHMGDFYRNILKTNDVRTGLKKPEQESKKRAPSIEAAQLADAAQSTDAAATAAADRDPGRSGQAATLASAAAAAAAEWDAANAAKQRHAKPAVTPAAAPEASAAGATEGKDPTQTATDAAAKTPDQDAEVEAAAAEAAAQASKVDRIAAARANFLARKRQKTGG